MPSFRFLIAVLGFFSAAFARATPDYTFSIVAGAPSSAGWIDGSGNQARFYGVSGIVADTGGGFYVADSRNGALRKISPSGLVTTIASVGFANVLAIDATGNVYLAVNSAKIVKVATDGSVVTMAGDTYGDALDGTAANARFSYIAGMVVDRLGDLYVTDQTYQRGAGQHPDIHYANTVRKITPDGTVTTIAGVGGTTGYVDGAGSAARFGQPSALAIGPTSDLYVLDRTNAAIRRVTPAGEVSTVAQNASLYNATSMAVGPSGTTYVTVWVPQSGSYDFDELSADGSLTRFASVSATSVGGTAAAADGLYATADNAVFHVTPTGVALVAGRTPSTKTTVDGWNRGAAFSSVGALALAPSGDIYVADLGDSINGPTYVRRVTAAGVVTTLATLPGRSVGGIVADRNGVIYVSDALSAIYKVTPDGAVTLFAGSVASPSERDGLGQNARFWIPRGLAIDSAGNIFVVDSFGPTIRKITPAGDVTTLAGRRDVVGYVDGQGTSAEFHAPSDLTIDQHDNLFVVDTDNLAVRKITPDGAVTTVAGGPNAGVFDAGMAGIAIDPAGNILLWDLVALRKIDPTGAVTNLTVQFEPAGPSDWMRVLGAELAIGPDGRVYSFNAGTLEVGFAAPRSARLLNMSARGEVRANAPPIIVGFVTRGGINTTLLRAVGPELAQFNVMNPAPAVGLTLWSGASVLASNAGWSSSNNVSAIKIAAADVGAFALGADSPDGAILCTSSDGVYTATMISAGPQDGVGLAEVYDVGGPTQAGRIINLSARGNAGTGEQTLIIGFVVGGDVSEKLLLRAAGPALGVLGVANAASAPTIDLFAGDIHIASNRGWTTAPEASQLPQLFRQVGAFPFAANSGDSAMVVELRPGVYSMHISAEGNQIALGEIYELPQ